EAMAWVRLAVLLLEFQRVSQVRQSTENVAIRKSAEALGGSEARQPALALAGAGLGAIARLGFALACLLLALCQFHGFFLRFLGLTAGLLFTRFPGDRLLPCDALPVRIGLGLTARGVERQSPGDGATGQGDGEQEDQGDESGLASFT